MYKRLFINILPYLSTNVNLGRSRIILLATLEGCIVTILKGDGRFLIKIMDGQFLIALQKL
jgi:hypothetical protein